MGTHLYSLKSNLQIKNIKKEKMAPRQFAMVVGKDKGHKVSKLAGHIGRQSRNKGKVTKKSAFVHDIIREVAGFAGYEKRCIELLRISKDKRALKFCKKRLGTHTAAKRKREEMQGVIQAQKRAKH